MANNQQLWASCLNELNQMLNDSVMFQTFFEPLGFVSLTDGVLTLSAENKIQILMIEKDENKTKICEAVSHIFSQPCLDVNILCDSDLVVNDKEQPQIIFDSNLKEDFTFDQFVVGASNKVAQAASLAVAINPGQAYNPLFIYGNSGLGKTHLLHAIGNYVKKNHQNMRVLYKPCLDFVDEYIRYIKNGQIDTFNEKYRSIDVFLVDDIQWLAGKEKSHEVFFQIFNHMHSLNKQIVITSDRMPNEVAGLEQRLVTRFNSGLSVGIDSPEFETALAILKKKLELRSYDTENIDEDVLSFMASQFSNNVRDLEGAVTRLIFFAVLENVDRITMNVALEAFKGQSGHASNTGKLTVERIKKTVSEYYNLTIPQLVGKSRVQNIAMARHIAMYLTKELLNLSYIKIGEEFGNRDHSTVMSACDKVSKLVVKDEIYKEAMAELKTLLK